MPFVPDKYETPRGCLVRAASRMVFSYRTWLCLDPEQAADKAADTFLRVINESNHVTLREDINKLWGIRAFIVHWLKRSYSPLLLTKILANLDIRNSGHSVTSSNKLEAMAEQEAAQAV